MVEQLHATDPDQGDGRRRITGVTLSDGRQLHASEVILTTGTFLRGLMHCGSDKTEGGRIGEPAAVTLSKSLNSLGLRLARLKTGTPPRVHRDSVRLSDLEAQPGDPAPPPFSFMNCHIDQKQVHCWITHTNERTHDILRSNINRAPLYSGQIQSCGPRYCPSIEDKIMRFADKPSHQVFLEPEGYDNPWLYCNGISTSTPRDVQDAMVHSIVGLEDACIEQYGYAIEYDWVPTDQIWPTLETKAIAGLSLAGQINGTSGYEEAAAQGLIAGANAALRLRSADPIVLGRDEAYIGVMIDDIVTRPPDEPYRMFTSRAEYRLHLRSDNADIRLTPRGRSIGLVDDGRWWRFEQKTTAIAALREALKQCRHNGQSLLDCLRKPGTSLLDLIAGYPELASLAVDHEVIEAVEIETKYAGYLAREQRQIDRHRQQERLQIPENCDFQSISTLRREARERLARVRPRSLGQAARMTGISPADIATLSVHLFSKKSAT
jgi:tRNA uridine 5-carboxymethylaminomethyl modification enzyme